MKAVNILRNQRKVRGFSLPSSASSRCASLGCCRRDDVRSASCTIPKRVPGPLHRLVELLNLPRGSAATSRPRRERWGCPRPPTRPNLSRPPRALLLLEPRSSLPHIHFSVTDSRLPCPRSPRRAARRARARRQWIRCGVRQPLRPRSCSRRSRSSRRRWGCSRTWK